MTTTWQTEYNKGREAFFQMLKWGMEDRIPNCHAFDQFKAFYAGYMSAYLAYKEITQ